MARDFSCLVLFWFLIPLQNTRALTVPIGAITNPNTRIGREQKVAIQLAVEKFSNHTLLAGVLDLNTTDPSPMYSYVQNLIQSSANTIIAGGTVPQVFVSGTVGEGSKVPIVSMVSSHLFSGTFLIQMSYSETALVRCLTDIVKSYDWRKVIAVYEDDVFGSVSSSALLLSNALEAIGSELEYRAIFPPADPTSDPRSIVKEELNHTKSKLSTVYIILRISEALAPILFEEAVSQGMMSKGYIWICGNDITALLDSSFTPSFISRYMQGLVGIRSYINENAPEYLNFRSNFQQRFKTEFEKSGENSFDPGVHAVRAYDVVDAISLAETASEKNNKTLVESLIASNFSGLSGLMRPINVSLDESERYSAFRIINVVGRSYREMGIWRDATGFYENEDDYMLLQSSSEKMKSIVFWPGGPLTTPSGLRRLKVGIPDSNSTWDNFVLVTKMGNSVSYSGFCIDVFTATLSCLGYEVLYDFVPYKIDDYDELVNKVYSREVDIVVGDVTILSNRSKSVQFTKPYLSSGLAMLVPVKTDTKGWLPTKAFPLALWMCILALFLYYILLVLLHELVEDAVPDFQGSWLKQIGASLWIVCNGIFLNLDKRIRSYHTKIVIILWFFVAQLALNSFTASLSSILVTQNLKPDVNTALIGCDGYSFVPDYLTSVLGYPSKNIVRIYSASGFKTAFENGSITAAYLEVPYLRVFLSHHENYTVSNNETQMVGGFGFVLPKGSPLANAMSIAILKIGENGTLRQLEKKWFSVSLSNYVVPDEERSQSLRLSNYTYMFVISSFLAFLTVLHRCFEYSKEQTHEEPQVQEVQRLEPAPNNALVQQEINGNPIQEIVHEMEDVPLHEVRVIELQPMEPQNMDLRPGMGRLGQRTRRTASSSNITRVLFSFLSDPPQRAQPIEERSLRDNAEHEVEDQPNLGFLSNDPGQGSTDFGPRFHHAVSFTNVSRTTRVPQSFYSLRSRRAQEIED